jgi:plasmid stability protein
MKNVTVSLDDEIHRKARIRAAELGTSLSALVRDYLNALAVGEARVGAQSGVREMPLTYSAPEAATDGPPWFIGGEWVYTPDGKPRQPGALRGKFGDSSVEYLDTPDWLIDIMEGAEDDLSDLLPFDESQLPPE